MVTPTSTNHLPVEALIAARSIISVMKLGFQLPIHKSRLFILDYPEILLVSVAVVATKLSSPFGSSSPLLQGTGFEEGLRFNWDKWREAMAELDDPLASQGKPSFDKVTADQVISMTSEQLDKYFAHISSLIDKKS